MFTDLLYYFIGKCLKTNCVLLLQIKRVGVIKRKSSYSSLFFHSKSLELKERGGGGSLLHAKIKLSCILSFSVSVSMSLWYVCVCTICYLFLSPKNVLFKMTTTRICCHVTFTTLKGVEEKEKEVYPFILQHCGYK